MKTISQVAASPIILCAALAIVGCGAEQLRLVAKGFSCRGSDDEGYVVSYAACHEPVDSNIFEHKYKKKIDRNRMFCHAFGSSTTIDLNQNPEQPRDICTTAVKSENHPNSVLAKFEVDRKALFASGTKYDEYLENAGTVTYFDGDNQIVSSSPLQCTMWDRDNDSGGSGDCPRSAKDL